MRKKLLWVAVAAGLITAPVWVAMARNTATSFGLRRALTGADWPASAQVQTTAQRVFNSGNGDGCDYQAIVVLSHSGRVEPLRDVVVAAVAPNATAIGQPEDPYWTAKTDTMMEITVTPNADHAQTYMITLTHFARRISLDPRCW